MFKWLFGGKSDGGGESGGGDSEVVVVTRKLPVTPDRAFAVFVDKLNDWWPRDLTWGGANLAEIAIEPKLNGHAYEVDKSGKRSVWGTVLSVQRPGHIVIAWQIRLDRTPEDSVAASSRVDVRFDAAEDGGTTVTIVHRDFRRHGDSWKKYHAAMGGKAGWPRLMQLYAAATAQA